MILADTVLPEPMGWLQIVMAVAAGVATLVLTTPSGDTSRTWAEWAAGFLPSKSSTPTKAGKLTVGEAYELLTRLEEFREVNVDEYGRGLDEATKHLTWRKAKPETPQEASP